MPKPTRRDFMDLLVVVVIALLGAGFVYVARQW